MNALSDKIINLSQELEAYLPSELLRFIKRAGKAARAQGQNLYVVGGVVRDLLLKKPNLDLDLVLEGDAIVLAGELAKNERVKLTTHSRFNTARLEGQGWNADIAMARSETYAHPGALPAVRPDTIRNDLFRRDFTVNAMAVCLNPDHYGELLDLFGGKDDLENKLIRILHEKSFIDDATRIWRAIRYEQRLGFSIERSTLALLRRDILMLDTVSGDRIRNELELVLKEEHPEKPLSRAHKLGVLAKVHPSLEVDRRLAYNLRSARKYTCPEPPTLGLNFALLTCRLNNKDIKELVSYLRIPKATAQIIRDTVSIMGKEQELAESGLTPSRIYHLLHGYVSMALVAASIAVRSETARSNIRLYLDRLRHIKTSLNGDDLLRLGVPAGPRLREVLESLRYARLDSKVTGRRGEEEMVGKLVKD